MIYFLFSLISAVVGGFLVFLFFRRRVKVPEVVVVPEEDPVPRIAFEEVVRLVNCFDGDKITELAEKMNLYENNSAFHDKCQKLIRSQREDYFAELAGVLARYSGKDLKNFVRRYPEFSSQDIALMLMCQIPVANRTIMKLMNLNSEALKKRKLRLKAKMQSVGLVLWPAQKEDA